MTGEKKEPDTSEPQTGRHEAPKAVARRPVNWDAVAAIIAALIGLVAILVAGYEVESVRQQTQAEVWPHINLGESDKLPTDVIENGRFTSHGGVVLAINSGVGPAIVRRAEVLVDNKPQPNWKQVFKVLGYDSAQISRFDTATSLLQDKVLSPNQRVNFLMIVGHEDWMQFKKKLFGRADIRICYCSTLGDCWLSTVGASDKFKRSQPVDSCAVIPKADVFHGWAGKASKTGSES